MKYLLRFHWIWIIIWFGGWGVFFFVFHQNTWLNWSGDGSRWLVSSHVLSPPHHQATSFTFTKEVKEGEVEEEGEEETFDEGVRIQPLKFGHVAFTFNFTFTRPHPPYFPASTTHPKRGIQIL
ncbi:hypothetical protein HMI55_004321 [Coelomomyces lativittatus]|nr:hypothetical protein HMI55_004321 [Coelomomyces lativittatus]